MNVHDFIWISKCEGEKTRKWIPFVDQRNVKLHSTTLFFTVGEQFIQ